MNEPLNSGNIVTFYSYKGGTGRSLLLANVALVLASNDRKVAVIDWDLEAPGLHRYLRPFLIDTELKETDGLIDMLTGYWDTWIEVSSSPTPENMPKNWEQHFLDIYRYAVTLRLPAYNGPGSIVFMPAGRQSVAYAEKVANFDWDSFYSDAGGKGFIDALRTKLASEFDYVLIDSRTGVSDTGGICTIQLPDDLVVCFTYNNQNILGAASIAAMAASARSQSLAKEAISNAKGDSSTEHTSILGNERKPFHVYPVPTRADKNLPELLEDRRRFAQGKLNWAIPEENRDNPNDYWLHVEQPYIPGHSYFETLACLTDTPGDPGSMLGAVEEVVRRITGSNVPGWNRNMWSDEQRATLRQAMLGTSNQSCSNLALLSTIPLRWTDSQLEEDWPVLIRLIKTESFGFRSVSASLLAHQSNRVKSLIARGILLLRHGDAGVSIVELSSYAKLPLELLLPEINRKLTQIPLLLEIENASQKWRESGGRDSLLLGKVELTQLRDKAWLTKNKSNIEVLQALKVFAPNEELYLAKCERIANPVIGRKEVVSLIALSLFSVRWPTPRRQLPHALGQRWTSR